MAGQHDCCFCRRRVIGLAGQDCVLDTFYLLDEPEDREVCDAAAFGQCHIKCLVESRWAGFWRRRRLANLIDVRGYDVLAEDDHGVALFNSRMGDVVFCETDGALVWTRREALCVGSDDGEFWVVPVVERVEVEVGRNDSNLAAQWEARRALTLDDLVRGLGVEDRLLRPAALREGSIQPLRNKRSVVDDGWVVGRGSYAIQLPAALARRAMAEL